MIQRLVMVAAVAAIALAPVAATAQAVESATPPPAKAAATTTAKERHMTGKVTSVNAEAKTVTLTRHMRREMTFAVAPEAAGSLAELKPGDQVRITYERSGGTLTAQSIAPLAHTTAK